MKIQKVVLATGGTGGHVIPALESAKQFRQQGIEVLLLGNQICKHVDRKGEGLPIQEIPSAPLIVRCPFQFLRNMGVLGKSVIKAKQCIKAFDPNYVIGFGSYHSFPVLLASILSRTPLVLHEQNIVSGKVNRLLTPFAKKICGPFKDSSIVTCLEEDLCNEHAKTAFLKHFSSARPIIVVVGGSQGAKSINTVFPQSVALLARQYSSLGIFHVVGSQCSKETIEDAYRRLNIKHIVTAFENHLPSIMSCADLVIGRAGARTMEELIRVHTPAILIPYPGAYNHQKKNAEFFAHDIQGGDFIEERFLTPQALAKSIEYALLPHIQKQRKLALEQYWKARKPITIVQFLREI